MSAGLSVLIGIASSIVASGLFWAAFFYLRPRISISTEVARGVDTQGGSFYAIKLVNRSWRACHDLRFRLQLMKIRVIPGGQLLSASEIKVVHPEVFLLKRYSPSDREASYAFRVRTTEDIDSLWSDDQRSFLRLQVYARDAISGLPSLKIREFRYKRTDVVTGEFEFGASLEVRRGEPTRSSVHRETVADSDGIGEVEE